MMGMLDNVTRNGLNGVTFESELFKKIFNIKIDEEGKRK